MSKGIIIAQSDKNLISDLAEKVVSRGMAVPAIFFLDMMKYLSFFGGQLMVFFWTYNYRIYFITILL